MTFAVCVPTVTVSRVAGHVRRRARRRGSSIPYRGSYRSEANAIHHQQLPRVSRIRRADQVIVRILHNGYLLAITEACRAAWPLWSTETGVAYALSLWTRSCRFVLMVVSYGTMAFTCPALV